MFLTNGALFFAMKCITINPDQSHKMSLIYHMHIENMFSNETHTHTLKHIEELDTPRSDRNPPRTRRHS